MWQPNRWQSLMIDPPFKANQLIYSSSFRQFKESTWAVDKVSESWCLWRGHGQLQYGCCVLSIIGWAIASNHLQNIPDLCLLWLLLHKKLSWLLWYLIEITLSILLFCSWDSYYDYFIRPYNLFWLFVHWGYFKWCSKAIKLIICSL